MKQSILITGGLGYIGSITTLTLSQTIQNYNIIILDNLSNSSIDSKYKLEKLVKFDFHEIDIRDIEQIRNLFKQYIDEPIKYIIHFAALKAVGESVNNPLKYYQNNVVGTINLLQCAQEFNCNNFLFSSSATVYPPGENIDEEQPFQPSNPYGETKVVVEYLIRSLSKTFKGRMISLRYFNPVGGTKDGNFGEIPNQPNNLFPYIELVAIGKKEKLNVFGNDYKTPDGTGVRDYLHIMDLAEGHIVVLKMMIEKNNKNEDWYDYFNLGSGKGHSVLDVIKMYQQVSGQEIKYQICGRREGDVAIVIANPDKAKRILGWEAKRNMKEMCEDSYNFIVKNSK